MKQLQASTPGDLSFKAWTSTTAGFVLPLQDYLTNQKNRHKQTLNSIHRSKQPRCDHLSSNAAPSCFKARERLSSAGRRGYNVGIQYSINRRLAVNTNVNCYKQSYYQSYVHSEKSKHAKTTSLTSLSCSLSGSFQSNRWRCNHRSVRSYDIKLITRLASQPINASIHNENPVSDLLIKGWATS